MKRIGILIPEFPGQTHNFFWREIESLREFGTEAVLFSTKLPSAGIQSTTWGQTAKLKTTYFYPVSAASVLRIVWDLATSPIRAARCFRAFSSSAKDLKDGESRLRLFALLLLGVHLGRMCSTKELKHIHVHSCADAANIAFFANAAFGVSYSLTLHNPVSIWGGNQINKWQHAKFGVVITEWILQDLQQRLTPHLPKLLFIAPMGVNVDVFRRNSPFVPHTEGAIKVFSCARLNPAKGFEVLLEAVDRLRSSGREVMLTIAGEDDKGGTGYRQTLEKFILSHKLGGAVRLLGAVSEERVRTELESAHMFVLASYEEPLGVAIMEAMAMEVPAIATNAGGVPSIISDGIDGLLVPPSDAAALAAAIERLADTPDLAVDLSLHGRARILDAFHHRLSAKVIFDNA